MLLGVTWADNYGPPCDNERMISRQFDRLTGRNTHMHLFLVAPCSTVVSHFTFRPMHTCIGSRLDEANQHCVLRVASSALAPQ